MSAPCRSCGAAMTWAETSTGKRMPVEPYPAGNVRLVTTGAGTVIAHLVGPGQGDHVSHFATCPSAGAHRKGR
jgi:hypothetical protein